MPGPLKTNSVRGKLLTALVIGAAVGATGATPVTGLAGMRYLAVVVKFLYGAAGTSVKAYVQTSFDGGATWVDIMSFAFTTAAATKLSIVKGEIAVSAAVAVTDGSLTDNTILDGVLGDRLRLKYVTTGTYTGATSLDVSFLAKA